MPLVAPALLARMTDPDASAIRRMFEEGAALKKRHGADAVFDFSLGNPDLAPPEGVVRAIEDAARSRESGRHGYMPNAGYPFARAAMAKKVSREQGVTVLPEGVVMSAGAAGALNCVLKALLSEGDEVLVPAPFFPEYAHYARNHGGTLRPVPSRADFSLDADTLAAALSPRTAAVLLNSPNNPTGKVYAERDVAALAEALTRHGERTGRFPCLICDEPYRDIVYGGRRVAPVFPLYRNAVVVSSFAKNLSLPGERLGYIALNPAMDDFAVVSAACVFATRILGFVNAPAFFQRVVSASWECKADYSPYEKRRNLLASALDGAGIAYALPEGAFYLFCAVPERAHTAGADRDDAAFCEHLKKHLVLCAPGKSFGGAGWFRMAYCVAERTIADSAPALKAARESW
ncbi:pyridoxal phosphate-dependent aminotransferase [Treponema endosymbiont of Eucomonympha sp.]|uniref:pyridoxal phosphate-dependent aminotransferase n=1 Tax=Treponema endosymbiont of Eucomonympha sp. TaxID=1580831 RepID=UPI0007827F59|nr:pyridoxal phosphate-dependent aminotransferase [Treponema endosymbiont of Eucomonympha sp.]